MTDKNQIKQYLQDRLQGLESIKKDREWTTAELGDVACCKQTLAFIDSLQEEPVSNDLEEAADNYVGHAPEIDEDLSCFIRRNAFIAGAKWKKKRLMENAVEAVMHPYDGEIWVDKDLLSIYNDYQHVKLIIIEGEHFFELGLKK